MLPPKPVRRMPGALLEAQDFCGAARSARWHPGRSGLGAADPVAVFSGRDHCGFLDRSDMARATAQAQRIIRLDPGLAFGTGTHPTTRMCLRWIVGTGRRERSGAYWTMAVARAFWPSALPSSVPSISMRWTLTRLLWNPPHSMPRPMGADAHRPAGQGARSVPDCAGQYPGDAPARWRLCCAAMWRQEGIWCWQGSWNARRKSCRRPMRPGCSSRWPTAGWLDSHDRVALARYATVHPPTMHSP